jgi:hypothetical protein
VILLFEASSLKDSPEAQCIFMQCSCISEASSTLLITRLEAYLVTEYGSIDACPGRIPPGPTGRYPLPRTGY